MRARSLRHSPGRDWWYEWRTLHQALHSAGHQAVEERWYQFWHSLAVSQQESARWLVRLRWSLQNAMLHVGERVDVLSRVPPTLAVPRRAVAAGGHS